MMEGDSTSGVTEQGVPPWMVTFADLMALMMTFFVLLYSYSKVDEEKYRAMVGSMASAFGGIQDTPSNSEDAIQGLEAGVVSKDGAETKPIFDEQATRSASIDDASNQEKLYRKLKSGLVEELKAARVIVEREGDSVIIRFPEKVSFRSGSDSLTPDAIPLIHRVAGMVRDGDYTVTVAGHTDDLPITTERFRSNWELSAARAVSVAHQVLDTQQIPPEALQVSGFADARPLVANDSAENRARNRRVEIIIEYQSTGPDDKQSPAPKNDATAAATSPTKAAP
ncbi:flagellar motor protein MotB [Algiphilus sp.]|uniref:flagellar motor protein MotB n=1 Tax=Algiphilus sp. TaxID=1872431 RepID=UPI002A616863|nr:OmpA family protein [Pseudomonadota bacterium]